jgi:hypothetical protein
MCTETSILIRKVPVNENPRVFFNISIVNQNAFCSLGFLPLQGLKEGRSLLHIRYVFLVLLLH